MELQLHSPTDVHDLPRDIFTFTLAVLNFNRPTPNLIEIFRDFLQFPSSLPVDTAVL